MVCCGLMGRDLRNGITSTLHQLVSRRPAQVEPGLYLRGRSTGNQSLTGEIIPDQEVEKSQAKPLSHGLGVSVLNTDSNFAEERNQLASPRVRFRESADQGATHAAHLFAGEMLHPA